MQSSILAGAQTDSPSKQPSEVTCALNANCDADRFDGQIRVSQQLTGFLHSQATLILGVPLFQEQLLRIAMAIADFTGGEAEELRRALGSRRSADKMRALEIKLRKGMDKNQVGAAAQEEII